MSPTTVLHLKSDTQKFARRFKLETQKKIFLFGAEESKINSSLEAKIFFNFQLIEEDEHLNFMFTLMSFKLPKHI